MSSDSDKSRLDDAARAGWLYFIAGNTQDEIARKLNVSRPTAQRLVSLSRSERLITFRLEHPITACMELSQRLTDRFALAYCDVVPSDPDSDHPTVGIAEAAGAYLEQRLRSASPQIVAIGTGRTMRATVEQVAPMDCPQHQLVSLVGNISPDGSASFFDALSLLAERTKAPHYPIPLPLHASSPEEREQLLALRAVRRIHALAEKADLRLVGIGQMDLKAQLHVDGFISHDELIDLKRRGAVGEIVGWAFDASGAIIEGGTNARITSVPNPIPARSLTLGVARGRVKVEPIRAALAGRIVDGLITDEETARALLE